MSLNAFMHPKNIYKKAPDFKKLAVDYPDIRKYMTTDLSGKMRYDFKNADALRVLCQTLLKRDFDLDVVIPPDCLVPTLPNRLNYILWLQDIVTALKLPTGEIVKGLDVGTGCCAVYMLLGSCHGWHMVGTEKDPQCVASAQENINRNGLQEQLQVLPADSTLLAGPIGRVGTVHFTLCNPPFFDSDAAADSDEARARRPPAPAAPTGAVEEVSCPGGERAFVSRLIDESKQLGDKCRVFTTMLGHKSSVRPLKRAMYEAGACGVITTELCQGNTKRWAIGWTFDSNIQLSTVKPMKQVKKRVPMQCLVPRNLAGIKYNVPEIKQHVVNWLGELQVDIEPGQCNKYFASYKITAREDTWTHIRRRRRALLRLERLEQSSETPAGSEQAPPTSELASEPSGGDLSTTSDRSDVHSDADSGTGSCGAKRSRDDLSSDDEDPGDGDDDGNGDDEGGDAAKRRCLEEKKGKGAVRRPALAFTLFVQKKGYDIYIQLTLLTGLLGKEGLNGVMLFLKNKMLKCVAEELAGDPPGSTLAAAGDTSEPMQT